LYLDVTSEAAFRAMDRNKDGFITKGELKLAKKKMSMKEVDQVNSRTFIIINMFWAESFRIVDIEINA